MNIANFFPPTLNPFKEADVRAAVVERSGIVSEQGMLIAAMDGVVVTDPASLERFFEHLGDEMALLNRAVLAQAHLIAAMREFWNEERRAQLAALTPEQRAAQTQALEHPMARFLRDLAAQAKAAGTAPTGRPESKLSPEVREALKAEAAKMRAEAEHDGQVPVLAVVTTPDGEKVVVDAEGNEAPDWMRDLAAHIEANKGDGGGPTGTSGFGGFGGDFGNGTVH